MSLDETHVSNNKFFRAISDVLDKYYFKPGDPYGHPAERAAIHGFFHDCYGLAKELYGNEIGAEAEYRRAREQYTMMLKGTPDISEDDSDNQNDNENNESDTINNNENETNESESKEINDENQSE